jgi:PAS domain S-box-containing protein
VQIRNQVLLVIIGLLILAMAGFAGIIYWFQYNALLSEMDGELKSVAIMAEETFPAGYIESIVKGTATEKDYQQALDQFNTIRRREKIDYLWAEMLVGNRMTYIAGLPEREGASQSDLKPLPGQMSDLELYATLSKNKQPYSWDMVNTSGTVRVLLIPFVDAKGSIYLVGAGLVEQQLEARMQDSLYSSLALMAIVLLLALLAGWLLTRSLIKPGAVLPASTTEQINGEQTTAGSGMGKINDLVRQAGGINVVGFALREHEEQIKEILDHSSIALYKRDYRPAIYRYVSPAIKAISGYSAEEMLNKSAAELESLLHPEDAKWVRKKVEEMIAIGEGSLKLEYRLKHKDGDIRWVEDSMKILLDGDGLPCSCIGSLQDITERKKDGQEQFEKRN